MSNQIPEAAIYRGRVDHARAKMIQAAYYWDDAGRYGKRGTIWNVQNPDKPYPVTEPEEFRTPSESLDYLDRLIAEAESE